MAVVSKENIQGTLGKPQKKRNPATVGFLKQVRWCPTIVMLFVLSLMVPSEISFSVGSLRLTPYKIFLIAAFVPSLIKLFTSRQVKVGWIDFLIFFHLCWSMVVLMYHHGGAVAIESGGVRILELGGAYLVARAYVTSEETFRGAYSFLVLVVCILAPITLFESLTGQHLIKKIASMIGGTSFYSPIGARFGMHRAYGPFDHPILYGVFTASLFSVAWFLRSKDRFFGDTKGLMRQIAIILAALTSVSSGAVAALGSQMGLVFWEKHTRNIPNRWWVLFFGMVFVYVVVDIISNRSGYLVFLSYLTFSSGTAYNRVAIFTFGIQDVYANPLLGIGFNMWSKPGWMHSSSLDNFWLFQAITFGVPGFLSLLIPVLIIISSKWKRLHPSLKRIRTGFTISMIGLMITACTVHFWNNAFVYFAFVVGSGAWFLHKTYQVRR